MKQVEQDNLFLEAVRKQLVTQTSYSVEDFVMNKIEQKAITKQSKKKYNTICSFLLMVSIVFECCLLFFVVDFITSVEWAFINVYLIQSVTVLAITLQINLLIQHRKASRAVL